MKPSSYVHVYEATCILCGQTSPPARETVRLPRCTRCNGMMLWEPAGQILRVKDGLDDDEATHCQHCRRYLSHALSQERRACFRCYRARHPSPERREYQNARRRVTKEG